MKKIFTFMAAALMAVTVFADNVLFKMTVVRNQAAANVTFNNSEDDLDKYAVVLGATAAKIGNAETSAKTLYYTGGYIRLDGNQSYLHITLPQALKVGDKINMKKYGTNEHSLYFYNRQTTRNKITVKDVKDQDSIISEIKPGVEYVVSDEVVKRLDVNQDGSQDLYFWYGSKNGAFVTDLTITGDDDPTMKVYPFMDYATTTYAAGRTTLVEDELEVISSGAMAIAAYNGVNAMKVNSESGKTRYVKLNLTDPGLVEFWCMNAQGDGERTLRWYTNAFSSGNREDLGDVTRGGVLTKITKRFEGLKDNDSVCIVTSADLYIVAIRVKYDKIRPAADLSASETSIDMKVGERKSVTLTTSSDVEIVRSWGTKEGNIGSLSVNEETHTYTFTATEVGDAEMIFTQAASTDYRAASVTVTLHIAAADTPTAIDDVKEANKVVKMVENGQVVILRDGVKYNILGVRL